MTLSGLLSLLSEGGLYIVLIPLLVDDPLRVFEYFAKNDPISLNPSFSG